MAAPKAIRSWTKWLTIARQVFIVLGLLNFAAFVGVAYYLGGDAVNGKAEGGHYYLYGTRPDSVHTGYNEVTKAVFDYSRWHVYILLSTWPLVMAAAFFESRAKKRIN